MAEHNRIGKKGELLAADFLRKKNCKILATNWRCGRYELDIIAEDGNELVVAEVKTRSGGDYESAAEAIDNRKIRRTVSAAEAYIKLNNISKEVRFDVVLIIRIGLNYKIKHIEDAFSSPVW